MLNQLLDTTIATSEHGWLFLLVFLTTAAFIWWEVRTSPGVHIGLFLAGISSLAAWTLIPDKTLSLGLLLATVITIFVGRADEAHSLKPQKQLLWQIAIAAILVACGWTIPYVTHPFQNGVLFLDWIHVAGMDFPADILAIAWIVLLMNAVNWIDGSDGLAGSVSFVGFGALAMIALLPSIQSGVGLSLAIIGLGMTLAFFIWNAPPAKVYLGTIGSWYIGMFLAITAMYGGGKIATGILVLALPLFDAGYVLIRRLRSGQVVWEGDTQNHIHHRLRALGISKWEIIIAAFVVTGWLAFISLLITTAAKLLVAGIGVALLLAASLRLWIIRRTLQRYT